MNSFKTLRLDMAEQVTTLTLNRPQTMNSINLQFMDELGAACEHIGRDPETRAVILTANGRGFCSGLDTGLFSQLSSQFGADELPGLIDHWQAMFDALENLPQISVAAINGTALGAGIELLLCTDFRIASTRALFGMPEVKLGMIPDLGGIPRLVRTVGPAWAKEMILRTRNFSAMEAVRIGLVNRVADHGDLMGLARKWARQFAALPPSAARHAKRLVNASSQTSFETLQSEARQVQLELLASPEFRAVIQALREKPREEAMEERSVEELP